MAVMYLGKIVEIGSTTAICSAPVHPYTEALLASIPLPSPGVQSAQPIATGELPDPSAPPAGCRFHTRCPYRQEICTVEEPQLKPVAGRSGYWGACHFQDELTLSGVDKIA
jgi:oligopeptide/dipeptide ABC transporter ATP-binding protein